MANHGYLYADFMTAFGEKVHSIFKLLKDADSYIYIFFYNNGLFQNT